MGSERSPESATEEPSVSSAESSADASAAAPELPPQQIAQPAPETTPRAEPVPNAAAFATAFDAEEAANAAAYQPTAAAVDEDPSGSWKGRVLDERYRIVRLLGEGGMGAVFVAEHLTLHKPVALKVVRAELAGNGEVAARFAREAMATAQFEHPHVASAIDYGTLPEGGAYFVMQLVRGRSLRRLIGDGKRLPWRRACELLAQVADALSAAKAAGIIHRDLKPDNVLVEQREDGSELVKVLDFGIAHVAPRETAHAGAQPHRELTRVGMVMGTPGYMSPEQALGDKVDHRADLYSLGVVLWECITGRELWDGPDLTTVVTRQLTEAVPRLRDVAPEAAIPPELDELVQKLTARTITDRPEHAAEVRDALRQLSHASGPRLAAANALAAVTRASPRLRRLLERYNAQSPGMRGLQAGAAAAGLLTALVIALGSTAAPKPQQPSQQQQQPQATVLSKMVEAAQQAVENVAPALAPTPPSKQTLPPELSADVTKLLEGKSTRERRAAAIKIRAYKHQDRVFPYLLTIAALEIARTCKSREQAIDAMKEQGDQRFLPSLRRLDRSPRSGCGFLGLSDCLSCVRDDLRDAIDAIEATQAKPDGETAQP